MVLYTDDTNILVTNKNKESLNTKLTMVMTQLEEWLSRTELAVNTQKSFVMYFHNRHHYLCEKPRVVYNDKEINYCSQSKLLGLHITENLNWKIHIQNLYLNLCHIFYIIKSLKDTISLQMILYIYYAHFEARLQYGIIFWGHDSDSIKIFRLQKGD
jgi:hypothetical protein